MATTAPMAWADCQPAPTGLVSWWAADGNATDLVGTNHGTLQGSATASLPAYVDRGFSFDGTNGFVTIPDATALKPAQFTIETWVKFDSLFSQTTGAAAGVQFLVHKQNTRPNNWFSAYALLKNSSHRIGFDLISSNQTEVFLSSSSVVQTGVWYHVVGVRGSNSAQLYINGALAQQTAINFASDYGNYPLYLGTSGHPTYDGRLKGQLDEVSLYQRALSAGEITALYAAGSAGKCRGPVFTQHPQSQTVVIGTNATFTTAVTGFGGLTYQWFFNDTLLSGATNSSLIIPNAQLPNQGSYFVVTSNSFGVATSSNAWLQLTGPTPNAPHLISVNPSISLPGTNLTLTGLNFSPTATNNLVHFGAVRAPVLAASSNSLTVTVPFGATFGPVRVTVNGLTTGSVTNFLPTFFGDGSAVTGTTLATGQNLAGGDGGHSTEIADLDGDGWPDLLVGNRYGHTISLFRNLGTGNPLTPGSFAPRVDFPALVGNTDNPYGIVAADVDGDGKLDLIFTDRASHRIGIQRNQSTAGTLGTGSFTTPFYFNTGTDPRYVRVADLDRDGRMDIVTGNYAAGTISILGNLSPAGVLDATTFAGRVDLSSGAGTCDVAIHDLDGDGRADVATVNQNAATVSLFRNLSAPGTLNAGSFAARVDLPANGDATLAVGDLDGDGKADLISGGNSTVISIFRNTSSGGNLTNSSFAPRVDYGNPGWVHNVVLGDINGDGKPDLIAVGELGSYLRVYANQSAPGAVTLASGVDYATGWNAWGVSVGDLDGDRRSDIVFCNAYDDTVTLYRNQQGLGGPPAITSHPVSQTVIEGNTATFSVSATGQTPLNYQWRFNGMNMVNATNATLTLTNAQLSQAGEYSIQLSNIFGALVSSNAVLTVTPPTCVPVIPELVGWWQAEGNGLDAVNANPTVLSNGVAFSPGKVGQSFSFDGANDFVRVSPSASLNVGTNVGMTIECWINPGNASSSQPLVEWNEPTAVKPDGVHFWTSVGAPGNLYMNVVDVNGTSHSFSSPSGIITANTFQHVAMSYDKVTGTATFYYNGNPVVTQPLGTFTPQTSFPLHFGYRPSGGGYFYQGLMDEIGIYNRALTAGEIQSLWQATSLGHCPIPPGFLQPLPNQFAAVGSDVTLTAAVAGSQPITYQWYYHNAALTNNAHHLGASSSQLTIANVQANDAGNYWLVASNIAGVSTSSVATVEVGYAPSFLLQPVGQTNIAGSTITLLTAVTGNEPLSYQWYQNTTALTNDARHSGATSTNLTITDLIIGDSGNYTLRVSNLFGIATSMVATLSVPVPPSITTQPKGYSVPVGLPVTLTAAATGGTPLRYQWVLNGTSVPNATNTSLTISNLALANFGNYQLVVTNGGGAITSAVAQLTRGNVATWGYSYGVAVGTPMWPPAGLSNAVAIAASIEYSLALRADGSVAAWSRSPTQATNVPVGLSGLVAIAAGTTHALGLRSNGTVVAWGGSVANVSPQTNVPVTLSNVIAIAAGALHSVAVRADGSVLVWGGNSSNGETNIPAGVLNITAIDAYGVETLALRARKTAVAWGASKDQFSTSPIFPSPPTGLNQISALSAGPLHDLAVNEAGKVTAWGRIIPATTVPANLPPALGVEALGGSRMSGVSLAILTNRSVVAWGDNTTGLTNVPPGLSNVLALAGGSYHALALVDDGSPLIQSPVGGTFYTGQELALKAKVFGAVPLNLQWLKNGNPIPGANQAALLIPAAQLADAGSYQLVASNALGVAQSVIAPVTVQDRAPALMTQPASRFAYHGSPFSVGASVIGSGPLSLIWLQNNTPFAADTNELFFDRALPPHGGPYQLIASNSFGTVTSTLAPITFSRIAVWGNGPSLTNAPVDLGTITAAASAYYHLLAIKPDGTVAAWGTTLNGATNVPPGLSNVVAVTGGKYFSVALRSDGTAVAWGVNNYGQTNIPVAATNLSAIAAGGDHVLGLRSNGTVIAWGYNGNGQTNIPGGLSNVVAISAGQWHSVALKSDGTAVTWGLGAVNPTTLTNLVGIAAGFSQSYGLRPNGTVITWMSGNQAAPTNLANVVALASGGSSPQNLGHTFALLADGTPVGWGNNSFTQLNYPADLTSVTKLSCGYTHTLAFLNDRSPVVATQPFARHVVSGTNISLTTLGVGQPALNYQWRRDGNDLPGATSATLTLTNVNRNLRGNYSALVWNALGSTVSRDVWLDVVGPVRLLATGGDAENPLQFAATDSSGNPLTAADLAWLQVQASTNLVNWQTIANALVFTNGNLLVQDPAQTNHPTRFYRLIER